MDTLSAQQIRTGNDRQEIIGSLVTEGERWDSSLVHAVCQCLQSDGSLNVLREKSL